MTAAVPGFTAEENARLSKIWDRLYEVYLQRVIGDRSGPAIEAEIEGLIQQRNAIRSWGWNTGRNWKDDIPKDIVDKMLRK
jgi:hypothetical protein